MKNFVIQASWAFGLVFLMSDIAIATVTVIDRSNYLGTEWKEVGSTNLRMEDCNPPYRAWVVDCHATLKVNSTKGEFLAQKVTTRLPATTCRMSPIQPSNDEVAVLCKHSAVSSLGHLAELLETVSKLKYEVVHPVKVCYYENVLLHIINDQVAKWSSTREVANCP